LAGHPQFPFASGRPVEKQLYLSNNALTATAAFRKIALSFLPYEPLVYNNIFVTPPLIRPEVMEMKPERENFLLAYMVNDGYAEEVMAWQRRHSDTTIHCFWDRQGMPDDYSPQPNLTFHQIDQTKFLQLMARCKGYCSTAGFESICEAMYLGKPAMMVPVASQYEQACNAIDAEKAGAGISAPYFDIDLLLGYMPTYHSNDQFRAWAARLEPLMMQALTDF
jgi:uncharacterized protein (TIGR00661 family)